MYNKLDKILFTKFYPGKILLRLTDYVRNWGHKDCPKNKKKKRKSASLLPKLTITDAVWFLKLWEKYLLNFWGKNNNRIWCNGRRERTKQNPLNDVILEWFSQFKFTLFQGCL